jgi:hypothetical protein
MQSKALAAGSAKIVVEMASYMGNVSALQQSGTTRLTQEFSRISRRNNFE